MTEAVWDCAQSTVGDGAGRVELRDIETFLVLAEELHFGRTAQRLYVSPSRISSTIRVMESRVGGRLFERTSRRVRLSPLGEQLRDLVRPAYDGIQEAFRTVAPRPQTLGDLRICASNLAVVGPSFSEIVARFRAGQPACRLSLVETPTVDGLERLRRGEVDVLAAWLPLARPDVTIGPVLSRQERMLAVQVGHPLAERGFATVEDLADQTIADGSGSVPDETLDVLHPRYTPGGRMINRRNRVGQVTELAHLVAIGAVVHPTVASVAEHYRHPQVRYIPLRGLPPMVSVLVWSTARPTPAVLAFADTASRFEPA